MDFQLICFSNFKRANRKKHAYRNAYAIQCFDTIIYGLSSVPASSKLKRATDGTPEKHPARVHITQRAMQAFRRVT